MINVDSLSELISEQFHLPPLSFKSIEEVLRNFFDLSKDRPFILASDEYSYLEESIKAAHY